jgi:hypothetical protein
MLDSSTEIHIAYGQTHCNHNIEWQVVLVTNPSDEDYCYRDISDVPYSSVSLARIRGTTSFVFLLLLRYFRLSAHSLPVFFLQLGKQFCLSFTKTNLEICLESKLRNYKIIQSHTAESGRTLPCHSREKKSR